MAEEIAKEVAMRALITVFFCSAALAWAQDKPDDTLNAVVGVSAKIQANARSAETLGVQRQGTGVLVRNGYALTIGYLVIEAESVQVTGADGRTLPATVAGYDHASGFALLRIVGAMPAKPLPLGDSTALAERDPAMAVTAGARDSPSLVYVVSRRPFSGSWEYLLDSAIYTYPPVMDWSGAPLISAKGELLGVGSLIVPDAGGPGTQSPGNMFVPIDLLKPILDDLIAKGRRDAPARPWLGVNADEVRGRLFVGRVSPDGPAARAGLKSGDIILAVGSEEVTTLAEFYRKVWSRGSAGTAVPLKVLQGSRVRDVTVRSIDRIEYFRPSKTY
ncbi:MAG TPA: S1C family serine protease [Burkholderiales bacterium]|jgi:S1-C subfamily serine protease|nr:S1C family serine protease [Burkholderiales bacterium]